MHQTPKYLGVCLEVAESADRSNLWDWLADVEIAKATEADVSPIVSIAYAPHRYRPPFWRYRDRELALSCTREATKFPHGYGGPSRGGLAEGALKAMVKFNGSSKPLEIAMTPLAELAANQWVEIGQMVAAPVDASYMQFQLSISGEVKQGGAL